MMVSKLSSWIIQTSDKAIARIYSTNRSKIVSMRLLTWTAIALR
ncbi:hypothetical protein [Nostoc sp. ChiSLP03a]|nr:hypothetical protein [Nostoc sp. ChiSLP03a]MDZ8210035.1 hypothetical protein [Nostoc sp. ChiSLP03a]